MKKVLALMLAAALTLSLAACGKGGETPPSGSPPSTPESSVATETNTPEKTAIPLQCGDSIDNENFCISFESIELLPEYSYQISEYSSISLYVEEGYELLIAKGHFENKSTSVITDSDFAFSAVVNDEVDGFDVQLHFIRDTYFEIDPYTDLDFVLYINIPEKLADMFESVTFTIGFNNDMSTPTTIWNQDGTVTVDTDNLYALTGGITSSELTEETTGDNSKNITKTISIGDTITTNDYEFTLTNVELTYEVLPPNTSSVYSSYAAESGKVYVHVAADVKNLMQRNIRIEELFTVSVLYDGNYSYDGFTVVNDGDNSFDWVGNYVAATPLEICKAHGLVECPAEVDVSEKTLVVLLNIGDSTYEYTIR